MDSGSTPRMSLKVPRRLKTFGDIYEADTENIHGQTQQGDQMNKIGNNLMWSLVMAGKDWKRNRDKVWREVQRSNACAAFIAMLGTLCAVAQNELIFRNWDPNGMAQTTLKCCNSVCSVITVYMIYRIYWVQILLERLRDHIDRGIILQTQVPASEVFLASRIVILEMLIVGIHLPPGCTFEFGTTTLQNYVVYRAETLFCLWNTLRLYLWWRLIRDRALDRIPQLFTIAHYTEVKLGSSYVTKRLLKSWASIFYIASVWAVVILLAAYWFRAMENTACLLKTTTDPWCEHRNAKIWALQEGDEFEKVNDLYLWNHIWLIFIVSTKGNNGAFRPTTHSSRFVAAVASTFGIILTSFLTAALAQALTFNAQEDSTNLVIRRERARMELKIQAVTMISRWFRIKTRRPLSKKQRPMLRSDMIKRFMETRRQALGDLDDLLGQSDKIDKLNLRTKRMEFAVYHLAEEHNVEKVAEFYALQDREKSIAAPKMPKSTDEDMDRHSVEETVVRMRRGSIGVIRDGKSYSPTRASGSISPVAVSSPSVSRRESRLTQGEDSISRAATRVADTGEDSGSRKRYLAGVPKNNSQDEEKPKVDPELLAQIPAYLLGLPHEGAGAGIDRSDSAKENKVHPFRADAELDGIQESSLEETVLSPREKEEAKAQSRFPSKAPRRFLGDEEDIQGEGQVGLKPSGEVLARLSQLEDQVRAVQSSQDSKILRIEEQLKQLEQSQRNSTAQILAALVSLHGTSRVNSVEVIDRRES